MATTATWAFYTALLAVAQSALSSTVSVRDGVTVTQSTTADCVYLGVQSLYGEDRAAVAAQQDWAGLSNQRRDEQITVYGVAYSYSGRADDYATLRGTVQTYLATLEAAIKADVTVAGSCLWAGMSVNLINQGPNGTGSSVDVEFSVTARARL